MLTLIERFNPRRNSFDVLRLLLAGLVAIDHGIIMRTGTVHRLHGSALGDFAVDGFFVLSGFLVARSYLRLGSLVRYGWHRALRIMPGFWVCLVLTAFVAAPAIALLEGKPIGSVFTTHPTSLEYLANNALLMMRQYEIADLLAGVPSPHTLDGALWTLAYEAACYVLIAVLGVVGILARRRWLVLALTVAVWGLLIAQAAGAVSIAENITRLMLMFLFGALAHLYAERLPVGPVWPLLALVVFAAALLWATPYQLIGGPAYAYLLIWAGACAPFAVSVRTDLSYGLYIYHFLIFQILMVTPLAVLPVPLFVPVGAVIALTLAFGSWHLVERPALKRKNGPFIQAVSDRLDRWRASLRPRRPVRAEVGGPAISQDSTQPLE